LRFTTREHGTVWTQTNNEDVRTFISDSLNASVSVGCNSWYLWFNDDALTAGCPFVDERPVQEIFSRRVIGIHIREGELKLLRKSAPAASFQRKENGRCLFANGLPKDCYC